MNTAVLDDRLSEFETRQEAADYDLWLAAKVADARRSETVSHEEAAAHFAEKRAARLERLKNAPSA